jgi:hypothetical protein
MKQQSEQPFESIESAYDFLRVLCVAVAEAKQEIKGDIQRGSIAKPSRRLDALRLAYYNVDKLEFHINRSRRILNDLRSLRRLLFEERAVLKAAVPSQPVTTPVPEPVEILIAEVPATPVPAASPSEAVQPGGKNGGVFAA